uniref:Uncharacterized protein n=1 Tax=Eutreptiella gymnastica TaxID=73025 RepID=A0A7S1N8E2_9EUGL|mmetsp:Transcript_13749/g.24534  ORF Transcript_13749/g.24534 Transcript_13749/m.24534 type:complete len:546 (+) Transcript_13749:194-1831(+)
MCAGGRVHTSGATVAVWPTTKARGLGHERSAPFFPVMARHIDRDDKAKQSEVLCHPWAFQQRQGEWHPVPGVAIGTCYREVKCLKGRKKENISVFEPMGAQLFNTYTQHHLIDGDTVQQLVRHSVISTRERSLMLLSLLRQMDNTKGKRRVRMLCLLTRRQGDEERLWRQQQTEVAFMEEQLQAEGLGLVHLSYQANANSHYNFWNSGEDANATSNGLSWLKYAEWLLTDILELVPSHSLLDSLRKLGKEMLVQIQSASVEPTKLQEQKSGWFFSRMSLAEQRPSLYVLLRQLANQRLPFIEESIRNHYQSTVSLIPPALSTLLTGLQALCHLVRSQYPPVGDEHRHAKDSKPLTRVSEFLSLALLDRCLGVTSCSNCKSGCDRSGLVHGLTTALNVLVDKYPNPWDQKVLLAVCIDFDRFAETVDESTDTFEQYICNIAKWEQCRRGELDRALSFVTELRNWTFINIMEIGWRINIHSTGLCGLKFHLGSVSANPHVVATLPPYIVGKHQNTVPGLQVIPVHKKRNLDSKFGDFMNGGSQYRGA